jgi:hypothetical protein
MKNDFCKIKSAQFGPTCMGSTDIYWLCKNYSLLVVQLTHSGWNKNMIFCHFKTQLSDTISMRQSDPLTGFKLFFKKIKKIKVKVVMRTEIVPAQLVKWHVVRDGLRGHTH